MHFKKISCKARLCERSGGGGAQALRKLQTYQNPIPDGTTVDAIAFSPNSDGHGPGDEDNQGLNEMYQVFGPP